MAPPPHQRTKPPWSGLGCLSSERPLPVTGTFRAVNSRGSPTARPCLVPEAGIGVAGSRRCGVGAPKGRPWAPGPLCSEPGLLCAHGNPFSVEKPRRPRPAQDARAAARRGPACPGARTAPGAGLCLRPRPVCRLPPALGAGACPGRDQSCRTGVRSGLGSRSCPLTADHAAARVAGSRSG